MHAQLGKNSCMNTLLKQSNSGLGSKSVGEHLPNTPRALGLISPKEQQGQENSSYPQIQMSAEE